METAWVQCVLIPELILAAALSPCICFYEATPSLLEDLSVVLGGVAGLKMASVSQRELKHIVSLCRRERLTRKKAGNGWFWRSWWEWAQAPSAGRGWCCTIPWRVICSTLWNAQASKPRVQHSRNIFEAQNLFFCFCLFVYLVFFRCSGI